MWSSVYPVAMGSNTCSSKFVMTVIAYQLKVCLVSSAMTGLAISKTHYAFLYSKLCGDLSNSKSLANIRQSCASTCTWKTLTRYIFATKEHNKSLVVRVVAQKILNSSILAASGRALQILSTQILPTAILEIRGSNTGHREQSLDWRS